MSRPPLIAITTDVKEIDGYVWHAAIEVYITAISDVSDGVPLLVPCLGSRFAPDTLLDRVDGILVTGSRSNVHPALYGEAETEETRPHDEARDKTTLPLIRAAITRGVPLLAICRGIQELNVALGGTLISEVQELDGRMDHRSPLGVPNDERFAIKHGVSIVEGGCLGRIIGSGDIQVNSVHRQAIGQLSDQLAVEATAPDGTIEAVCVKDSIGFAIGVQWHPEYWAATDSPSRAIFEAFGDAARKRSQAVRNNDALQVAKTNDDAKFAEACNSEDFAPQ